MRRRAAACAFAPARDITAERCRLGCERHSDASAAILTRVMARRIEDRREYRRQVQCSA